MRLRTEHLQMERRRTKWALVGLTSLWSACGGGSGTPKPPNPPPDTVMDAAVEAPPSVGPGPSKRALRVVSAPVQNAARR